MLLRFRDINACETLSRPMYQTQMRPSYLYDKRIIGHKMLTSYGTSVRFGPIKSLGAMNQYG